MGEAAQLCEKAITDLGESAAEAAIVFDPTGEVVVAEGVAGGKEGKARLRAILTQASIASEEEFTALKESIATQGTQKRADLKALAEGEIAALRANAKTSAQSRKEEIAKEKKALLGLKVRQLLTALDGGEMELLKLRNFGQKSLNEVREKLVERGFDVPASSIPADAIFDEDENDEDDEGSSR
mgnify:CR=1 FL=1